MYVIDTRIKRRAPRNLLVLQRKNHGSDVIALNALDFVPGVGLALQHTEIQIAYQRGEISFAEAMFDVTAASTVAFASGAALFKVAPSHLAAERTRLLVTRGPHAIGLVGAALVVHAVTKKGADVEHGPYGTVRVTPRLGLF